MLGPMTIVGAAPRQPVARRMTSVARPRVPAQPLPAWPLGAPLLGYPLWWVLGLGDMAWILAAAAMVMLLMRRGDVRLPSGFWLWGLFMLCMLMSVVNIDSGGRLIGFVYRALLYGAATVVLVYVYNARERLDPAVVARQLTGFWGVVVAGGFLGAAAPMLTIRTPLAMVLPQGILSNELVREMAIRRTTQFDPTAWAPLFPRPSAPFLYTNGWGNAFSILLPIAIAWIITRRGTRAFPWLVLAIPVSLVPAFLTLNRGMFLGLGIAGAYIALRALLAGNRRLLGGLAVLLVVGLVVMRLLPVTERLDERLETSSTTEDRASLYEETFLRTLESPVLGHGAPRPSLQAGVPSAGTQGQFWMVLFSHGFPAIILFVLWFAWAFIVSLRWRDAVRLTMSAAILVTLVEILFYSILGTGLMIVMACCGVVMRPPSAAPPQREGARCLASP